MEPITTSAAAKLLNVSPSTVARLIRRGEIRAVKKTTAARNSPYLVDPTSVAAYRLRRQLPQQPA